ncbi:MAG: glycosyltransferase, partial [Anaerolineae bacterium]|nr:glycosyltransferase [Anaerolineae bacterium]
YYNHGQYLPSALKSLSQQSTDQFNLYVVNDGSIDSYSREVFHKMSQAYQEKANWFFIDREENYGLSETRNYAASLGKADYLLFMDSDNIASPHMVERFAECLSVTDYACLTCNVFWFQGNDAPFLERQPGLLQKPVVFWSPLGDCVELGLFHDCWGDANFIIQRSVFEAIGKFAIEEPLDRYRTGEDWEILARLSFAGYKIDVIPEVLFFYRYLPDSLNRTANEYESITRALRVYADQLEKIGLHHLIPWIYQVYKDSQEHQRQQAQRLDASEIHLMYEHLKQDPAWIADNIPWSKAIQGMLRKISKKVMKNREAL